MISAFSKLAAACFVWLTLNNGADGPKPAEVAKRQADQTALKPFAGLVGPWKGAGQPQRGNTRGSWVETGDWAWSLTPDSAALKLTIGKGKYLSSALLKPGEMPGSFRLEATLADGTKRDFAGTATPADKGKLVLVAAEPKGDGPRRITLTPLHDTRFLLLLESNPADAERYQRLGEIGYTRQGVAFAAGDSSPVCIVTGGRGTIQVSHEGKTYWVCCSGCRDLFKDDPKAILAEAEVKKKGGK